MSARTQKKMLLILTLTLVLRFWGLSKPTFWVDEAFTFAISKVSLPDMLAAVRGVDVHPPLFYALTHFWMKIGESELWMRTLPVIFSFFTVAAALAFGTLLLGDRAGLLLSFALAVSSYHEFIGQELRFYSLQCLLVLLSFYFFWRAAKERKISLWIIYTLTTVLAGYTAYTSFLAPMAQAIFLLLRFRTLRHASWPFLLSGAGVFLCFIPWLPSLLHQLRSGAGPRMSAPTVMDLLLVFCHMGAGYTLTARNTPLIIMLALLFLIPVLRGAWVLSRCCPEKGLYITAGFFTALGLVFGISVLTEKHIFASKYFFAYSFLFYILLLAGTVDLWGGSTRLPGLILACAALTLNLTSIDNWLLKPEFAKQNWPPVTGYVEQNGKEGDIIIIQNRGQIYPFCHYYRGNLPHLYLGGSDVPDRISKAISGCFRIWLIQSNAEVDDPDGAVRRFLERNFIQILGAESPGLSPIRVFLFERRKQFSMEPPTNAQRTQRTKWRISLPASFCIF